MKKNCNPLIGNSPQASHFSTWRKYDCNEKLNAFVPPKWNNISNYFAQILQNQESQDFPCYKYAYTLMDKCLNKNAFIPPEMKKILHQVPQMQAIIPQQEEKKRKRKHILEEETEEKKENHDHVKNVLVLGMMGILPNQYDLKRVNTMSTYPPPLRDYNRLQALQQQYPEATIYTLNLEPVPGIKVQPTHIFTSITGRGARAVSRTFPGVQFDLVVLDYFRFPAEYMENAYKNICAQNGFLDTLAKSKMLSDHFDVFIPHLKFKESFCLNPPKREWKIESVPSDKNPLSYSTQTLSNDLLGGYTNQVQLDLLQPITPFNQLHPSQKVKEGIRVRVN